VAEREIGTEPASARLISNGPLRGLPREVAVLAAVAFFVAAGFGIVAPAIPLFARSFGVSRAAAGAVISAFALMRLSSALGVGRLVNRIGERIVLGAGIGIVAVSSALAGFASDYMQLLVLRGAGGIGSAMFSVSANSPILSPDARIICSAGRFLFPLTTIDITGYFCCCCASNAPAVIKKRNERPIIFPFYGRGRRARRF